MTDCQTEHKEAVARTVPKASSSEIGFFQVSTPTHSAVVLEIMPRKRTRPAETRVLIRYADDRLGFFRTRGIDTIDAPWLQQLASIMAAEVLDGPLSNEAVTRISYRANCDITVMHNDPRKADSWDLESWRCVRFADRLAVQPQLPIDALRDDLARLQGKVERQIEVAVGELLAAVGDEVLSLVNHCLSRPLRPLAWLATYHFFTAAPLTVCRNRRQAVQTFPLLAHIALQGDDAPSVWRPVLRAVDAGGVFVAATAKALKCKPAAVRHLMPRTLEAIGPVWADGIHLLLRVLSSLPPERYPEHPEHWRVLEATREYFQRAAGESIDTQGALHLIGEVARAGWRFAPVYGASVLDALITELASALIVLRQDIPARRHAVGDGRATASDAIFGLGLQRAGRLAARWLAEDTGEVVAKSESDGTYPKLIDSAFRFDNLVIQPLLSSAALIEESHRMSHCVRTYDRFCAEGRGFILSVRDAQGQSRSTVQIEIVLDQSDKALPEVIQHKAYGNGAPEESDRLAVAALCGALAATDLQVRLRALAKHRVGAMRRSKDQSKARAGRFIEFLGRAEPRRIDIEALARSSFQNPALAHVV